MPGDKKTIDVKPRIEVLENSRPGIVAEIHRLKARRAQIMKELAEVSTSLQEEENKLDALPEDIEKM